MNESTELPIAAETFSAVVATVSTPEVEKLDGTASTWCGSGMARTRDD